METDTFFYQLPPLYGAARSFAFSQRSPAADEDPHSPGNLPLRFAAGRERRFRFG
jgi:hypothetical protein